MKNEVIYTSPVGESLAEENELFFDDDMRFPSDPSINYLIEQTQHYWQNPVGCGYGLVEILDDGGFAVSKLAISRLDEQGFWLQASLLKDQVMEDHLAINDQKDPALWVELDYAGEPESWPAMFFHPAESAKKSLHAFCQYGIDGVLNDPTNLSWVPLVDVHLDQDQKKYDPGIFSRLKEKE